VSDVYIDSLTVKNFGPYYGEHTFNFTTHDNRCGILVGGKNGAGKTHLLRALYLAVTGETGVHDLKKVEPSSESTRFVFEKSLNRRAESEGEDTVLLQVMISQRDEKGSRKAMFVREIHHRPSGPVWKSYAERFDGSARIVEQKHLEALRDALLPRHLARFFFFDAERGQNFSLGQQEIVEGISRILGLWSYSELETDLRELSKQKIPRTFDSARGNEAARKLADITGQIVTAEKKLINYRDELSDAELELRTLREELADTEERLKSLGAVDPADLKRVQDEQINLREDKVRLETQLTGAWERAMPLALLGKYRRDFHDHLAREEKRRDWETSRDTVEPKIPQIRRDVFEDVPEEY
jgi:DNA sulfur modification protein DndD